MAVVRRVRAVEAGGIAAPKPCNRRRWPRGPLLHITPHWRCKGCGEEVCMQIEPDGRWAPWRRELCAFCDPDHPDERRYE